MHRRHNITVIAAGLLLAPAAPAQAPPDWEIVEVAEPQRRAEPPRPTEPPELPQQLADAPPLTFEVVTRWASSETQNGIQDQQDETAPGAEQIQRVARTSDRVLIEYPALDQQWLFERNPVDPRRVHGKLIIPGQWLVIEYNEADLADSGVARSWVDVMSLGLAPAIIEHMTRSHETMQVGNITARLYTPPPTEGATPAPPTGLVELWWSDELLMPLRIVTASPAGRRIMEVRSIERSADPSRLQDPSESRRLLTRMFTKVDVSDWREDYHGNHMHIAGLPCGMTPTTRPAPRATQQPAPAPSTPTNR